MTGGETAGGEEFAFGEGPVAHGEAITNGVRLHYATAGPADGDLVVLLHGFPECWYTWRRQLPALAAAGYRVVAPDLRGYNRSEKPRGTDAYRLPELAADIEGLVSELGSEEASLVGHDWGGVVAWKAAMEYDSVSRLVVLNAPHPVEYVRGLTAEQALRSWYAAAIQLPWLPEVLLGARECRAIGRVLREGPAEPGAFTEREIARFRRAACRPGAMASMLSYYRAFARHTVRTELRGRLSPVTSPDPVEPVAAPTLVCWGERDAALSTDRLDGLDRYATDLRIERFPGASHWVHRDRPEEVTRAILAHLP
ncbi:alpha/beta fold hydrolase [Saliphagus sp. LR7]|uniref:alpha/beta fold hydrolase n=1 Tax=Saliphagus sp. LR7 TaxID=2282654 RepID=UPI000DF77B9F|nr:alpha/beta hydrolase [Saliphagus sp. LR7]